MNAADVSTRVLDLISRVGITSTFEVVSTEGTYHAQSGMVLGRLTTDYLVTTSPPLPHDQQLETVAAGTLGSAIIYVPAENLPFTPDVGCKLTAAGSPWTILGVEQLSVEDATVAYVLDVSEGAAP